MSALSDFFENKVIDHIFRDVSMGLPTSVHVALFTAAPGEAGGGTEVTGGAYARVAVVRSPTGSSRWATGSGGLTDNLDVIQWAQATANWGTVVAMGIFDASTGGNLLWYGNLTTSLAVNNGDQARFAVGALDLSVA